MAQVLPKKQMTDQVVLYIYILLKKLKALMPHIWYPIRIWIPLLHIFQDTNWHNLSQLMFGYASCSLTPEVVWVFPEPKVLQLLPVLSVVLESLWMVPDVLSSGTKASEASLNNTRCLVAVRTLFHVLIFIKVFLTRVNRWWLFSTWAGRQCSIAFSSK